jgi:hypothetical protein
MNVAAMEHDRALLVSVPQMMMDDPSMSIRMEWVGMERDDYGSRARFAYQVMEEGEVKITGADLCGPATGQVPDLMEMVVTLAGFLGATYECGQVTEHGESYPPAERAWLETHAERFNVWAYDMEMES